MFSDFLFSINVVMPIFMVMCIGYIMKRKGILGDSFVKASNTMIFYVALPIKLFHDMVDTSINEYLDIKFIAFIVLGTIISAIFIWVLGAKIIKDKYQLGAFVHGAFRGNFLYIGLSLMENMTGSMGLKAPLIIAFVAPLYNVLAIILLTSTSGDKTREIDFKEAIRSIAKNPLIISIVLGIIGSQINLSMPLAITRTMDYFNQIVTPLALITIGATFNFKKSTKNLMTALYASGFKLVLSPLIAVLLASIMGFAKEDILLIYILFGVPSAIVSYIMTTAMGGDSDLSSNIIMMTTLLSVFTMTLFVFVFKIIGFI